MSSVSWRAEAALCKLLLKGLTVSADGANYIIDALEVHDIMYKLRDIFADPSIVKVTFQDRTSTTRDWREDKTILLVYMHFMQVGFHQFARLQASHGLSS